MQLSRKGLWTTPLSDGLWVAWKAKKAFGNFILAEKCQLSLKGTKVVQNKRRLLDFWGPTGWADKTTQLQICFFIQENGWMIPKASQRSAELPLLPGNQRAQVQYVGRALFSSVPEGGATCLVSENQATYAQCRRGGAPTLVHWWALKSRSSSWWATKAEHQAKEHNYQAFKSNKICPAGFQTCLGPFLPCDFSFLE